MLLVCIACPVSVSVHLVCLGRTKLQGTRDTTPAVCSVSLLLAAAAPALGFDVAILWDVEQSRWALDPGLRDGAASAPFYTEPAGSGLGDGPRCAVDDCDGSGSPSLGSVTSASHRYFRVGWGIVRIVTTGSRRVVTMRLAQTRCRNYADNLAAVIATG